MSDLLFGGGATTIDLSLVAQLAVRSTAVLIATGLVVLALRKGTARRRSLVLTLCGGALLLVLTLSLLGRAGNWGGVRIELPLMSPVEAQVADTRPADAVFEGAVAWRDPGVASDAGADPAVSLPLGNDEPKSSRKPSIEDPAGEQKATNVGLVRLPRTPTSLTVEAIGALMTVAKSWPLGWALSLALVWMAGAAVALLRLACSLVQLTRLTRRAATTNDSVVAEVSVQQVQQRTRLLLSDEVTVPMTWGMRLGRWASPTIILPSKARRWSRERLRVVLLHELGHIQRGDWGARMSARLVRCFYWWHPLVHWTTRRLELEQELACDEWVTRRVKPSVYARQLLSLHDELVTQPRAFSMALPMLSQQQLERRMMNVLDPLVTKRSGGATAVLIGVCFLTLVAAVQPQVVRRAVLPVETAPEVAEVQLPALSPVVEVSPQPVAPVLPSALAAPSELVGPVLAAESWPTPAAAPAVAARAFPQVMPQALPALSAVVTAPSPESWPTLSTLPALSAVPVAVAPTDPAFATLPNVVAMPSLALAPVVAPAQPAQSERELTPEERERAEQLKLQIEELHQQLELIRSKTHERREEMERRAEEMRRAVEAERRQLESEVHDRRREIEKAQKAAQAEMKEAVHEYQRVRELQVKEMRQELEREQRDLKLAAERMRELDTNDPEALERRAKMKIELEKRALAMEKRAHAVEVELEKRQAEMARRIAQATDSRAEMIEAQQRAIEREVGDRLEAQQRAMEALHRELEPHHLDMEKVARELERKAHELERLHRQELRSARSHAARSDSRHVGRGANQALRSAIEQVVREEAQALGLADEAVNRAVKEVSAVLGTHRKVHVQDGGVGEERIYVVGSPNEVRSRLTSAWAAALEDSGSDRIRTLKEAIHRLGYQLLEIEL